MRKLTPPLILLLVILGITFYAHYAQGAPGDTLDFREPSVLMEHVTVDSIKGERLRATEDVYVGDDVFITDDLDVDGDGQVDGTLNVDTEVSSSLGDFESSEHDLATIVRAVIQRLERESGFIDLRSPIKFNQSLQDRGTLVDSDLKPTDSDWAENKKFLADIESAYDIVDEYFDNTYLSNTTLIEFNGNICGPSTDEQSVLCREGPGDALDADETTTGFFWSECFILQADEFLWYNIWKPALTVENNNIKRIAWRNHRQIAGNPEASGSLVSGDLNLNITQGENTFTNTAPFLTENHTCPGGNIIGPTRRRGQVVQHNNINFNNKRLMPQIQGCPLWLMTASLTVSSKDWDDDTPSSYVANSFNVNSYHPALNSTFTNDCNDIGGDPAHYYPNRFWYVSRPDGDDWASFVNDCSPNCADNFLYSLTTNGPTALEYTAMNRCIKRYAANQTAPGHTIQFIDWTNTTTLLHPATHMTYEGWPRIKNGVLLCIND